MGYMDLNKKARSDSRVDKLIELTAKQAAALQDLNARIDDLPRPAPVPVVAAPTVIDYTPAIEDLATKIPNVEPLQKTVDFLSEEVTRLRLRVRSLESTPPPAPLSVPTVIKHIRTKSPFIPHLSVAVAVNFSLLIYLLFSGRF